MLFLKYFFPFVILVFSGNIISENLKTDSERIAWDINDQLEWNDFKASPQNSSDLDAYTMLGLSLEVLDQKDGKVNMGVFGYFEKNKSWVKTSEKTDHLLHHEQKHFDLCEVYRRKLVQRLESNNPYSFKKFSKEVGGVFDSTFQEYTEEQERYDHETNHSQKKEAQKKWDNFIQKELRRLKKYDKIAASLKVE